MPRQRGDRDGGNRIRPKMLSDAAQRNPGDAERGGMECANTPDSTRVATVDSSTVFAAGSIQATSLMNTEAVPLTLDLIDA